jgi:hypothetical protein
MGDIGLIGRFLRRHVRIDPLHPLLSHVAVKLQGDQELLWTSCYFEKIFVFILGWTLRFNRAYLFMIIPV